MPTRKKSPPRPKPGGRNRKVAELLLADAIGTRPALRHDSTVYPAFFMAPAINPRTVCRCQPIFSMISTRVAPPLRCSIATTCAVLLPARGELVSHTLAAFWPLGARFAEMPSSPPSPWRARPARPVRHVLPSVAQGPLLLLLPISIAAPHFPPASRCARKLAREGGINRGALHNA